MMTITSVLDRPKEKRSADASPEALRALLASIGAELPISVFTREPSADDYEVAEKWNRSCVEHLARGQTRSGIELAIEAIQRLPLWLEPYHQLGFAYASMGRPEEAARFFRACIAIYPYYDPAHNNLMHTLEEAGDLDGALRAALDMESVLPGTADNLFRIATIHLRAGRYDESARWFDRGLNPRIAESVSRMLPFGTVTMPKLVHDLAQLERLLERGLLPGTFSHVVGEYRRLIAESPRPAVGVAWSAAQDWQPCTQRLTKIGPFYRRATHIAEAPRVVGPTIRPDIDIEALEARYRANGPARYAVIDDFLTRPALTGIRDYLLDSTIWHNDAQEGRTYVGAYRNMGLRSPLMDQIIDEVTECLAPIIESAPLEEIWAYRNIIGSAAIGAHADFSHVNVNLWLTDETANRSPGTGGLVLFERRAPDDWGFSAYNEDTASIDAFIDGAERVTIPYRENRMVVFDPAYFHASDAVDFGERIQDWRVNLTLLFGSRRHAT